MWAVFLTSFFMSIMFPTIFALGLEGLGPLVKLGGSLLVMSIVGGAALTPVMAWISQRAGGIAYGYTVPLSVTWSSLFSVGITRGAVCRQAGAPAHVEIRKERSEGRGDERDRRSRCWAAGWRSRPGNMAAQAAHYEPTLESLNQHPLPQWYADAKLGIFIHWGLYSVPGWAAVESPQGGSERGRGEVERRMPSGTTTPCASPVRRRRPIIASTMAQTSATTTSLRSSIANRRSGIRR